MCYSLQVLHECKSIWWQVYLVLHSIDTKTYTIKVYENNRIRFSINENKVFGFLVLQRKWMPIYMVRRVQIHEIIKLTSKHVIYGLFHSRCQLLFWSKFKNNIEKAIMRHVFLANDNRVCGAVTTLHKKIVLLRCYTPHTYINTQWTFLAFLITCQRIHGFVVVFNSFCCISQLLRSWNTESILCTSIWQDKQIVFELIPSIMCTIQMQRCSNAPM